jgi:hypothetical protein
MYLIVAFSKVVYRSAAAVKAGSPASYPGVAKK